MPLLNKDSASYTRKPAALSPRCVKINEKFQEVLHPVGKKKLQQNITYVKLKRE